MISKYKNINISECHLLLQSEFLDLGTYSLVYLVQILK